MKQTCKECGYEEGTFYYGGLCFSCFQEYVRKQHAADREVKKLGDSLVMWLEKQDEA